MIPCPKCKSETEVYSEIIFVDPTEKYEWKKKGKGIKAKKYKRWMTKPTEIRVFLKCKGCVYYSDNLNGWDTIKGYEEECESIVLQIYKGFS